MWNVLWRHQFSFINWFSRLVSCGTVIAYKQIASLFGEVFHSFRAVLDTAANKGRVGPCDLSKTTNRFAIKWSFVCFLLSWIDCLIILTLCEPACNCYFKHFSSTCQVFMIKSSFSSINVFSECNIRYSAFSLRSISKCAIVSPFLSYFSSWSEMWHIFKTFRLWRPIFSIILFELSFS